MEIRKADSKGRLTGFTPGGYYRMDPAGRVVRVEKLVVELEIGDHPEKLNEQGSEYLSSFGLDPKLILREECNEWGYWQREMAEDGFPEMEYGAVKKTRKPWPEDFEYHVFVSKALNVKGG